MAKKPITTEAACLKMATLCSHSEQCESDIVNKLIKMGLNSAARKEVIEFLKEEKFLDNKRFAGCYARDKARFSAWGPLKIKANLISKRIPSHLISEALASVDEETWHAGLMRNAISKAKSLDLCGPDGREDRIKLYRYLLGKGFPSALSVKGVKLMRQKQTESNHEELDK